MAERPSWLNVVGGKDHSTNEARTQPEAPAAPAGSPEASDIELIRLNKEIRANLPADYKSRIRKDLVEKAAGEVMGCSVAQLYATLSQPDIWSRPSHTVAALEEVRLRLLAGSMAPRG